MKVELLGAYLGPLMAELINLEQGSDKAIIPCGWSPNEQYNAGIAWVWCQGDTTVDHSFTFFQSGTANELCTVTVLASTTMPAFSTQTFTLPAGGLRGLVDHISVRHNTNAQKSSESSSHVNEGTRIFAGVIPLRPY